MIDARLDDGPHRPQEAMEPVGPLPSVAISEASAARKPRPIPQTALAVAFAVALLAAGGAAMGLFGGGGGSKPAEVPGRAPPPSGVPGLMSLVAPAEVERAIAMLMVEEPARKTVRTAVLAGTVRLAWLQVSDSDAEDGDWVRVSGAGVSQDVRLFKKPLTVAVPYVPGSSVTVTGLVDGDRAGITAAVHTGGSSFPLKSLAASESILVPTP